MLDVDYIINNVNKLKEVSKNKKLSVPIDEIVELNTKRKGLIQNIDKLKSKRNLISKEIPKAKDEQKSNLINESKDIRIELSSLEPLLKEIETRFRALMLRVPNITLDDVPVGDSDKDNLEIRKWGTLPNFDFEPKDHVALGTALSMLDIKRGVKVAGSKNYFLKNEGALLEFAILRFAQDMVLSRGFSPFIVPLMVKKDVMEGTGYFPGGEDQSYYIDKDSRYLVGTSEVSLASYYKDEILDSYSLPIRMAGISSCFRREAGTYGKDTHGLYRVHQFQKVEQVVIGFNDPIETKKLHLEILSNAEDILKALELPYRVVIACSADLGLGQVIKHDIEVWMPSRASYGETHSCSSFYDFQSRRLNIKYKDKDGKTSYAHTLNNTAIASPRILIPLLEHYQLKDGSIKVPKALQAYMNGQKAITKKN